MVGRSPGTVDYLALTQVVGEVDFEFVAIPSACASDREGRHLALRRYLDFRGRLRDRDDVALAVWSFDDQYADRAVVDDPVAERFKNRSRSAATEAQANNDACKEFLAESDVIGRATAQG